LAKPATDQQGLSSQRIALVQEALADSARQTEQALHGYLNDLKDAPGSLVEAMGYSLFAGGKRVRPGLVFAAGRLFGAPDERLAPPAAAMECVHTFSLIHDDLPAMDDDDLRRGRPTSHKVYGEAMAILAGDALVTFAFEILTRHVQDPVVAAAMVRELAVATGPAGMIGGQVADMEGERLSVTQERILYVHERKTGALIAASARLGALAAGATDADTMAVGRFGYHLGLAFQLADDALDATATAEQLGKRAGKDTQAGKQTMVRLLGVEATMRTACEQVELATACLAPYGEGAEPLRALAGFVIQRSS
jgi:geranylgeranyl diphosphate synthase, type II